MSKQPSPLDSIPSQHSGTKVDARPTTELPRAKVLTAANAAAPAAAAPSAAKSAASQSAKSVPLAARPAEPARDELDELREQGAFLTFLRTTLKASPSWLTSMVVHIAILLVLALLLVKSPPVDVFNELIANSDEESEKIEDLPVEEVKDLDITDVATTNEMVSSVAQPVTEEVLEVQNNLDTSAVAVQVELSQLSDVRAMSSDMMKQVGALGGSDLSGRGNAAAKAQAIAAGGGSKESEEAVAKALKWLAEQQMPDGGWSFDSPNSLGTLKNGRNGATGLALLPFLGAGMTHREGKYKAVVQKGLYFLTQNQKPDGGMNDGGSMYAHGICAIVLAEAFAMTQDKALHAHAQGGLNFIMKAQDKVGGGWRYAPGQPGDTSVVGWQLMALKSGHMGYLAVDPRTVAGATNFLNSVQSNSGGNYGYTGPGAGAATTAVGLLSRMYLGWKKDHAGIEHGVEYLGKQGPSPGNMYYNYYATQVMHHYEGEPWRKWNAIMRDQLVNSQEKAKGPLEGSWLLKGDHGSDRGGRIYCTAMCCMTLEVYYRHMPIYRKQAAEQDFEGP